MKRAFSLVELSIVLVILGLLVGGILAGQSLIRASELRAVNTEHQRYVAAVHGFRDKYFGMPGDLNNAETIWGQLHATAATCADTASTSALTCNGDGDGSVEITTTRSREIYRFWQQLANAGLIEGSYSGTYVTPNTWGVTLGTNITKSKLSNAGFAVISRDDAIATGGWYGSIFTPANSAHWFEFGMPSGSNGYLNGPALKNEEAWNIDTKADDGKPGTGKMTTFNNSGASSCASSDTANSATYQLTQTATACVLMMGI